MNFREKYQSFIFDSYDVRYTDRGIEVEYLYKIDKWEFKPIVFIKKEDIVNEDINDNFLKYLFFNYGVINAINYYKLTCSKKFIISCGYLDEEQKGFFKKLFYNGLGELFYRNNLTISYQDFLDIETKGEKLSWDIVNDDFKGNLIPVGGGKDSALTLEYLRKEKDSNKCLLFKRDIYPEDLASLNVIKTAGYETSDILSFNVTLDKTMLELNKEGFYNGHIPFSSCLAFASFIMAYLGKKKYIVLSNEASANEGNVSGLEVNHQYSKSFEFEQDFRRYTEKYFTPHIEYFSLLRCFNEYKIIKEFLKHQEYLKVFRSCNVGIKENVWCHNCSKCLYVTIMLYPFVSREQIKEIFGKDMMEDMQYKDILKGLVLEGYDKPFECVGTKEEVNYALKLAIDKYQELPVLLEYYKQELYDENREYNVEDYFNKEHFIKDKFLEMMGIINEK